tara:strand:- start:644 stop:751 length:108 start_codon:yes stop_codon:yes gene_type:complete
MNTDFWLAAMLQKAGRAMANIACSQRSTPKGGILN